MPSTSYDDNTFAVRTIGARTNSSGTPVTDIAAEEDRLAISMLTEGWLIETDSFKVAKGESGTFEITVGSDGARTDYYVVPGTATGQGNYLVRLAAKNTITLTSANPTNPRLDEVYVVVEDDAYDSNSRSLGRLAVRKGDASASPVAPGPDADWSAYSLLATLTIPAGAADILTSTLEDERPQTQLLVDASTLGGHAAAYFAATGHNHDADYADITHVDSIDGHPVATTSDPGLMDSDDKAKLDDISAGAQVNPSAASILTSLKTVDGAGSGLDADMVDGLSSGSLALTSHNHNSRYYTEAEVDALVADKRGKPEGTILYLSSDSYTYASGEERFVPLNTVGINDWGGFTLSGAPYTAAQIGVDQAGLYIVTGQIAYEANGTGFRDIRFVSNNVGLVGLHREKAITSSGQYSILNATAIWYATNSSDEIQMKLYHTAGTALAIKGGLENTWFRVIALEH